MDKNMKFSTLLVGLVFLLVSLMTGCSDDDKVNPEDTGTGLVELKLDKKIIQFVSAEASSQPLQLTSNVHWTAMSSASWCKLSQKEGDGDTELTVSVTTNSGISSRTAQILISANNYKDTVEVVQFGKNVEYVVYVNDNERVIGDTMRFDCIVGAVNLTVMSNVDFSLKQVNVGWAQLRQLDMEAAYDNAHYYRLELADNSGGERYGTMTFQQKDGKFTKELYFGQREFRSELRINEEQYLGSHFRVAEFLVTSLGVKDWYYEFLDEDGQVITPDWLTNPRKVECTKFKQHVGDRYYLRADCKYNESNEPRSCYLNVYYFENERKISQKAKITQLANNGRASDSLVLMHIVEKNTVPAYGIQLNWSLAIPVTSWEKVKWVHVDGTERINRLALAQVWLAYDFTAEYANLSELVELNVVKNFLTGPVPEEISLCSKLELLHIFDNYNTVLSYTPSGEPSAITAIPGAIFEKCKNLKEVSASVNAIQEIPAEVSRAENLEFLDLSANDIKEVKATDWSALTRLKTLRLSRLETYKGPFFDFIFQMPSLTNVVFMRTNFDGAEIPDRWNELPNLQRLDLTTCHLTGELPKSLAQCPELVEINLAGYGDEYETRPANRFTGTLPAEYGALSKLQVFSVSNNNLTGTIPDSYLNWLNLWNRTNQSFRVLGVFGNRMTGDIPAVIKEHDTWTGKKRDRKDLSGKTVTCSIGDLAPGTFICPQQFGYGFDNCD